MSEQESEKSLLSRYRTLFLNEITEVSALKKIEFEAHIENVMNAMNKLQPRLLNIRYEIYWFVAILNIKPHLILLVKNEEVNTIEIFDYQTSKLISSMKTDMKAQETKLNYVSSDDKLLILQYGTYTYFYDIQTLTRIYETQDTYEQCAEKDENSMICVKDLGDSFKIDIFDRNELTLQKYECLFKIKNIESISGNYLVSIETEQVLKIWGYGESITQISELKLNAISAQLSRKGHYLAIHAIKGLDHRVVLYNILTCSKVTIQISSVLKSLQFTSDENTLIILDNHMMLTYYYINTGKKFSYQIHSDDAIQKFFISDKRFGIIGLYQDYSILIWNYADFNDVPFGESDGINVISPLGFRFAILNDEVKVYGKYDDFKKTLDIPNIKKAHFSKYCYLYNKLEIYRIDQETLQFDLIYTIESDEIVDFYADDDSQLGYILGIRQAYIYNFNLNTYSRYDLNDEKLVGLDLTRKALYSLRSEYKQLIYYYSLQGPEIVPNMLLNTYTLSNFEFMRIYKDAYYLIATSLPEIEVRKAHTLELRSQIPLTKKVSNILFIEEYALIQYESGLVAWYNMTYNIDVFQMMLPKGIQTAYLSFNKHFMYLNTTERSFKYKYPFTNRDFYIYGADDQPAIIMDSLYEISTTGRVRYSKALKHTLISPGPLRISVFYLYYNIPIAFEKFFKDDHNAVFYPKKNPTLAWAIEKGGDLLLGIFINAIIRFLKENPKYAAELYQYLMRLNDTGHPLLDQLYEQLYVPISTLNIPKSCNGKVKLPISYLSSSFTLKPEKLISKQDLQEKGQVIEFKSIIVPLNFTIGSRDSLQFLENILECGNKSIFATSFIHTYVLQLWKRARWLLIVQSIRYVVYLIAISYFILYEDGYSYEVYFLLVLNTFMLAIEAIQMTCSGFNYVKDVWNWIDLSRSIICYVFIYTLLNNSEKNYRRFFLTILSLLSFVRGIGYFRVNKSTRYFVNLLFEVIKDMSAFVAILLYTIISYYFIYLTLFYDEYGNLVVSFKSMTSALALLFGDMPDEIQNTFTWCISILFLFINPIIMFNLLISILGETYERVKGKSMIADTIELVELIIEASQILFWNRNVVGNHYYQVCSNPTVNYESEDPSQEELDNLIARVQEVDNKLGDIPTIKNEFKQFTLNMEDKMNEFEEKLTEIHNALLIKS